jgi:hypothetical protein
MRDRADLGWFWVLPSKPERIEMTFYLRKEWIDQVNGIDQVLIHYATVPVGSKPDWDHDCQVREMYPERGNKRKRRAKVIKLPRSLKGAENYHLHYYFEIQGTRSRKSDEFIEEIISDDSYTFIDYEGQYTNICVYWSINGWGAPNYSSMFEDGTLLDNPLSSLHFYGHAHDADYIDQRYEYLRTLPLPHIYRGRVHGPRGSKVFFCFHIMRRGAPYGDDYDFWDNNDGLNYYRELK